MTNKYLLDCYKVRGCAKDSDTQQSSFRAWSHTFKNMTTALSQPSDYKPNSTGRLSYVSTPSHVVAEVVKGRPKQQIWMCVCVHLYLHEHEYEEHRAVINSIAFKALCCAGFNVQNTLEHAQLGFLMLLSLWCVYVQRHRQRQHFR